MLVEHDLDFGSRRHNIGAVCDPAAALALTLALSLALALAHALSVLDVIAKCRDFAAKAPDLLRPDSGFVATLVVLPHLLGELGDVAGYGVGPLLELLRASIAAWSAREDVVEHIEVVLEGREVTRARVVLFVAKTAGLRDRSFGPQRQKPECQHQGGDHDLVHSGFFL